MTPPANSPPLRGTHTDAEFEQVKAELAIAQAKFVTCHDQLEARERIGNAQLATSQAQVARLRGALRGISSRINGPGCGVDTEELLKLIYSDCNQALTTTATADRARTYPGIAHAMAEQWSRYLANAAMSVPAGGKNDKT